MDKINSIKYILDTSVLLDMYDRYHPMDIFPTFWKELQNFLNNVYIPQIVLDEIEKADELITWINENYKNDKIKNQNYIGTYQYINKVVEELNYYPDNAISKFFDVKKADCWLIAIAKDLNYTIVTSEKIILSKKKVKIPAICKFFKIRCINRNEFFREIKIKI